MTGARILPRRPRRELRRLDLARRGLVAVVAGALVLSVVWLRASGSYGGPEHVSAQLADAGGSLGNGADVKLRGVIIGRVSDVARGPEGGVRVRLALSGGQLGHIPANVVARILPATVFGTSYVDLTTRGPASGRLHADAVIPADRSQGTLELQQALDDIDEVVKALGGAGETVTDPAQIGPALDRAFASGVPYLVNVITDVNAAYPRNTFGI